MLKFLSFGIILLFSSSLQATDDLALEYIKDLSVHVPEAGSFLGLSEYDTQIGFIQKNQDEVEARFNTRWRNRLEDELTNLKEKCETPRGKPRGISLLQASLPSI
jgi:hypothetical protein